MANLKMSINPGLFRTRSIAMFQPETARKSRGKKKFFLARQLVSRRRDGSSAGRARQRRRVAQLEEAIKHVNWGREITAQPGKFYWARPEPNTFLTASR
jgi:hypothetical protein